MFFRRTIVCLFMVCFGVRSAAAQSLTDQIPQGTVLAVQIRGLEQAQARFVVMANAMGEGMGDAAGEAINGFKNMILEGRELKGVAKDGRVVFALTAFPGGPEDLSAASLIVETADYQALRDSLGGKADEAGVKLEQDAAGFDVVTRNGQTYCFVKRGKFTAISENRDTAEKLAKQKTTTPIKTSKRAAAKFQAGDVGLYVDMVAVNREYGEMIDGFREQIGGFMELAAGAQPGLDPELAKAQMEAFQKVFDGMFTFVRETTVVIVSGSFEKTGLALSLFAEVKPDGSSAKFLSTLKPAANPLLAQMPDGHQIYVGMVASADFYKAVGGLGASFAAPAGVAGKLLEKQIEAITAAGPRNMAVAASISKGLRGVSISNYDKVAAALEASVASSQAAADAKVPMLKDVKVERNAAEHRGVKLTKVSMKFDVDALGGQRGAELAAAQLNALFGQEMVQWIGATDRGLIQIMGPDLVAAKASIDQILDGKRTIGKDESFADALKNLPAENTLVALIDLPALMSAIFQQVFGQAGGVPAVELPPGKPTYLGIALVGQSNEAELAIWFPSAIVSQFMQMFQGIRGEIPNQR